MSRAAIVSLTLLLFAGAHAEETPVRDPMRPFGGGGEAGVPTVSHAPRFALTGVLIAPTRRVAMINGRAYTEGESVDGAQIVAIEPNTVRLREQSAELVISLGRPERRPATVQGETVHDPE